MSSTKERLAALRQERYQRQDQQYNQMVHTSRSSTPDAGRASSPAGFERPSNPSRLPSPGRDRAPSPIYHRGQDHTEQGSMGTKERLAHLRSQRYQQQDLHSARSQASSAGGVDRAAGGAAAVLDVQEAVSAKLAQSPAHLPMQACHGIDLETLSTARDSVGSFSHRSTESDFSARDRLEAIRRDRQQRADELHYQRMQSSRSLSAQAAGGVPNLRCQNMAIKAEECSRVRGAVRGPSPQMQRETPRSPSPSRGGGYGQSHMQPGSPLMERNAPAGLDLSTLRVKTSSSSPPQWSQQHSSENQENSYYYDHGDGDSAGSARNRCDINPADKRPEDGGRKPRTRKGVGDCRMQQVDTALDMMPATAAVPEARYSRRGSGHCSPAPSDRSDRGGPGTERGSSPTPRRERGGSPRRGRGQCSPTPSCEQEVRKGRNTGSCSPQPAVEQEYKKGRASGYCSPNPMRRSPIPQEVF